MNSPVTFTEVSSRSARRVASRARRADRVPALLGLQRDADAVLDALKVMIVGVGAVGATVALSLAHLYVGELRLVDRARFKQASLLTQPVTSRAIGQPKAGFLGRLCKDISPSTRVLTHDGPVQNLALADMAGADIVVVAGDNLSVLHDTAQRCLNLGTKMIHAAVHGESLTAQCRTFSHANPGSPCAVCLFGEEEFRMMSEERVFSCEGFRGAGPEPSGRSLQPTMSLRPLCALCGEMAALQALRMALELGPSVQDALLEVCAHTWRSIVTPLRRNPQCPAVHERYAVRPASRIMSQCTLAELSQAAGPGRANGEPASLSVEGFRWAERGLCACAQSRPLHQLVRAGELNAGRCPRCRKPVHPQPFYSHEAIPASFFERFKHRTLRSLGADDCRGVLVRRGQRTVLLTNPTRKSRA